MQPTFARQLLTLVFFLLSLPAQSSAQNTAPTASEKIIIDTDIGDDVDDAFAVALALRSPELQILGITTTFGDTETRAKLLDRLLGETGYPNIPVAVGIVSATNNAFTQRRYAEGGKFARVSHALAVDFILDQIRRNPGRIRAQGVEAVRAGYPTTRSATLSPTVQAVITAPEPTPVNHPPCSVRNDLSHTKAVVFEMPRNPIFTRAHEGPALATALARASAQ